MSNDTAEPTTPTDEAAPSATTEESAAPEATPTRARPLWRTIVSWALATLLFVTSFRLLHTIGGTGGIVSGIAVTCVVTWLFAWWRHHGLRRQAWIAARTMTAFMVLWSGISFAKYVLHENGDTVEQRISAWGRNHNLGYFIDRLEQWVYSDPPSKEPAKELVLDAPVVTTTATTVPAKPTATTIPEPEAPAPLTTYFPEPLPFEGQWGPVAYADGHAAMWATSVRPLPEYGGVVASMVAIDQTHIRAALFNGAEEPGGSWSRDDHVPEDLYPALMAVMNSGFRMEQMEGGYMTEGKTVQPLINGRATLGIDRSGHISIGEYGRDMVDDGSWATLRQNLVLMLDHGVSGIEHAKQENVFWGAELDGTMYVNRSAVCIMNDGRLAYVMAGKIDGPQFAEVLLNVGCDTAMQLDVNGAWPTFLLWEHAPDGTLIPHRLDSRMNISPLRYTQGSSKDFFAFFDASLVPAFSVLDV